MNECEKGHLAEERTIHPKSFTLAGSSAAPCALRRARTSGRGSPLSLKGVLRRLAGCGLEDGVDETDTAGFVERAVVISSSARKISVPTAIGLGLSPTQPSSRIGAHHLASTR